MWKFVFIGFTSITLYFSYSVAQHGGILGFFAGVVVGTVITYLFTRYKAEAAATANVNTQNVQVNLNQQRINRAKMADPEFEATIDSILEQKLLLLLNDRSRLAHLNQQFDDPRLAVLARRLHELDNGHE